MNDKAGPQSDATTGHQGGGRAGWPVDPLRLSRTLLAGRYWLLGIAAAGLVVGLLVVKLGMTSGYQTTAVLKYEGELRVAGLPPTNDAIGPAADALKRQAVLSKIREETGFEGSLTTLAAAIGYDMNLLSNTVQITVGAETAEDAAEFARIVTDVFTSYHEERQARRIESEIARIHKRIEAAELEAGEAREAYNDFRELHGIADLSTEQHSMVQSAAKLRADSELAGSEVRAAEAEVASLEAQLANTPKTSVISGGASPERAAYNRLRQELASAKATLSPEHPRVLSLQQQVNELGAELRSGGGTHAGGGLVGANATYTVVEGRLREAKSRLATLRERQKGLFEMAMKAQERVGTFSQIEGEATSLLAEVKVNENLVSGLRRTEAALEDALRDPPSGFVVLDPGAVPEYPVRNKMKVVVFGLILLLAAVIGLVVVLRDEFRGFRLKTPSEIAFWGNGPVLAATSWPTDPEALEELVAGLDDFAPDARGSLLIVGGSPGDSALAQELAGRMNEDWFVDHPSRGAEPITPPAPAERAPLQTPPPSGPYPIGGASSQATALARRPSVPPLQTIQLVSRPEHLRLEAWEGPYEGQALRRAARLADRVVVLVRAGTMSALRLSRVQQRLGRQRGIGYILLGLPDEYRSLPDRAGPVAEFWAV